MKHVVSYFKEKTNKSIYILLGIVVVFIFLRLPSLTEPYWYGDEGVYQVIGMSLREGNMLYKEIWDNKPPFLYLIYAMVGGDQFSAKFISLIFGAFSIVAFFYLAKIFFRKNSSIYLSTFIYAVLFGLPLLEGNIANAENFMLLPIILAFYIIFSQQKERLWSYIVSGALLSCAFLFKIVALFDFIALITILGIFGPLQYIFKHIKTFSFYSLYREIEKEFLFSAAFIIPIMLTIGYFFVRGSGPDYLRAAFFQNIGYVGYANHFIIPQGLLYLKIILLLLVIICVIRFKKVIGFFGAATFIWVAFSLFSALFSARPYTHYLLVLLPSFCLLAGYIVENKKLRLVSISFLLIVIFIANNLFYLYKKNIPYYINYLQFVFGGKTVQQYFAFFDSDMLRDYEIAQFVNTHTSEKDNIFLWSDSGQIYKLTGKLPPGRYIVSYHITFYPDAIVETQKKLDEKKPKYIIDTKHTKELAQFLSNYNYKYTIRDSVIYERKN